MNKDLAIGLIIRILFYGAIACVIFVGMFKLFDKLDKENQYEHAYVLVGEDWQNFELKDWTNQSRTHYKLYIKDGTVLVVLKANTILYNGELPAEVRQ